MSLAYQRRVCLVKQVNVIILHLFSTYFFLTQGPTNMEIALSAPGMSGQVLLCYEQLSLDETRKMFVPKSIT